MKKLNILAISGSLRKQSTNMGLIQYAQKNAPENMQITIADITEIPFFNSDIETQPDSVKLLLKQIQAANGFILACPEYNYSIAPALKNALDWGSRVENNSAFAGKTVAIMGSGGGMGTSRAQYHLRQVCVYLDLHVLNKPEVFCNAFVGTFDDSANLIDEKIQSNIDAQLQALAQLTTKFA